MTPRDPDATPWFKFAGANVRGTPAMRAAAVEHDLEVLRESGATILVMQEFRWRWYWAKALLVLKKRTPRRRRWASSPPFARGLIDPVRGAQPVMWRRDVWRRRRTRVRLLHRAAAGISENRYIRAVLLEHRATGLRVWAWTAHYVVGGDHSGDPHRRVLLLAEDVAVTDGFLAGLAATGHPTIGQIDANLTPRSSAWPAFRAMLKRRGVRTVGTQGVEYLLVTDGSGGVEVEEGRDWIIPTSRLRTDHEVRGLTARLKK